MKPFLICYISFQLCFMLHYLIIKVMKCKTLRLIIDIKAGDVEVSLSLA